MDGETQGIASWHMPRQEAESHYLNMLFTVAYVVYSGVVSAFNSFLKALLQLLDYLSVNPSPGLTPAWRYRSFGATVEKRQHALSHLSYSGWPHILPCNRQELILKKEQHLHSITTIQST